MCILSNIRIIVFYLLLAFAVIFISSVDVYAENFRINPTPQSYIVYEDSVYIPTSYKLIVNDNENIKHAVSLLEAILPNKNEKTEFKILIGVLGDKSVRKYKNKIPQKKEGYYLKIYDNGIIIAGYDKGGTYYGVQTLSQLLSLPKLPVVEITDYPDVQYRGVVEGFYGTPWSHKARMKQLDFYGKNKMNTYIYGPKNDPYHSSPNWRKPYPAKEAEQIRELIDNAHKNNVKFYWAIHPGRDIKWNEEDKQNILSKFEAMYKLGVRAFAVFFDDISGSGTKADKQAELMNYIEDNFVKIKGDVEPLIMCPTEYNKKGLKSDGVYLSTLGEKLSKSINAMWTGNRVIANIDNETLDFINPILQRNVFIWLNYPVTDYIGNKVLVGPVYGNSLSIKDKVSGFVSNPMSLAESSKIALYSIADYTWNMKSYNSKLSWEFSIKSIMPQSCASLMLFASHNCDVGNGHYFYREESVKLQPFLKVLLDGYLKNGNIDDNAFRMVYDECENIIRASNILSASRDNLDLINELKPWLHQFKLIGEYGKSVLNMLKLQNKCNHDFINEYNYAKSIYTLMQEEWAKCATKVLLPTLYSLFEESTKRFNANMNTQLSTKIYYNPYTLGGNVEQLVSQPITNRRKGVAVTPILEVVKWQPDGQIVISIDYPREIKLLYFDLGINNVEEKFHIEVSVDGTNWQNVPFRLRKGTEYQTVFDSNSVKEIRLINVSNENVETYFKKFILEEK